MSTAALALYILKKSEFELSQIKEGWLDVQRDRARKDYREAIAQEGNGIQRLEEYLENNRETTSSRILEPGYCQELEMLLNK